MPIPGSRVTIKKGHGGIYYVYFVLESKRDKNKNPKTTEVLLGRKSDIDGYLIPNNTYFWLFSKSLHNNTALQADQEIVNKLVSSIKNAKKSSKRIKAVDILGDFSLSLPYNSIENSIERSNGDFIGTSDGAFIGASTGAPFDESACGSTGASLSGTIESPSLHNTGQNSFVATEEKYGHIFALTKISDSLGLTSILRKVFPDRWRKILTIAFYMACEGNVMSDILHWYDQSRVTLVNNMTDRICSKIFREIDFQERMHFFKEWIASRIETEYLIFDVTSISTHSDNLAEAEFGHNRDGEHLPQINFGMFYGHSSRLPVFYDNYQGSITDVSTLPYILGQASQLGIKNVSFILDRGFLSRSNLTYLYENNYDFIIPLSSYRTEAKKIIDSIQNKIHKSSNWIEQDEIYGMCVEDNLYNFPVNIFIYYNITKARDEEARLYAQIKDKENELAEYNTKKQIKKSSYSFFDIEIVDNSTKIIFNRNNDKIDELINRCGYFLYLSTKKINDPSVILATYKSRNEIEHNFKIFKQDLIFNRLRTHYDETTEGKLFIGFISLILRTAFIEKVKKTDKTKKLTLKDVFKKLKLIKVYGINSKVSIKLPPSRLQKDIYEALGLFIEDLSKTL